MSLEGALLLAVFCALGLALILAAIAVLHLAWGLGSVWPLQDEASLARAVVGRTGLQRMPPPRACFLVAAALICAALWPLASIGLVPVPLSPGLMRLAGWVLALVFLARGLAAYLPQWRRLVPQQPFARLDRALYGPLCLMIGLAFLTLLQL